MKKIYTLILAGVLILILSPFSLAAGTYNFIPFKFELVGDILTPMSEHDIYDLKKRNYYTWGIDLMNTPIAPALDAGETISSASLRFMDIYDAGSGPGELYVHLLDKESVFDPEGDGYDIDKIRDSNRNVSDEFYDDYIAPTEGISLFTKTDIPVGSENMTTFTYDFTTEEIDKLNLYISDKIFGLGFDSNSDFFNNGVLLSLTTKASTIGGGTTPTHSPEPSTIFLMLSGLIGINLYLARKRVTVP